VQLVLDFAQRERMADMPPDHEADDLGAVLEIPKVRLFNKEPTAVACAPAASQFSSEPRLTQRQWHPSRKAGPADWGLNSASRAYGRSWKAPLQILKTGDSGSEFSIGAIKTTSGFSKFTLFSLRKHSNLQSIFRPSGYRLVE